MRGDERDVVVNTETESEQGCIARRPEAKSLPTGACDFVFDDHLASGDTLLLSSSDSSQTRSR